MDALRIDFTRARRWLADEAGASSIEYALMASLIAMACMVAFTQLGAAVFDLYAKWVAPVLAALGP